MAADQCRRRNLRAVPPGYQEHESDLARLAAARLADQTDARNHGNHDGWLEAKASDRKDCAGMPFTMGYYDREDIPFYYALADAFTICDQNFCSTLTGTTPNRLHLWTGTIREKPDPASTPNVRNSDVDYGASANWKTFPGALGRGRHFLADLSERIERRHRGWKARTTPGWRTSADNPLEWFDQYHVAFRKTHASIWSGWRPRCLPEIEKLRTAGGHGKGVAEQGNGFA